MLSAMVLLAAMLMAVFVLVWTWHFFPDERIELKAPAGKSHRAISELVGFQDPCFVLRCSDWPWTFFEPVMLGSIYDFEDGETKEIRWSQDGSVIALESTAKAHGGIRFLAAYDYREHRQVHAARPFDGEICSCKIQQLMEERGGIGAAVTGAYTDKGEIELLAFPPWGWVAPVIILILGGVLARRVWCAR